jgi:hypothetical protein
MNTRLLSFLSDFENALLADDPSPGDGGTWQSARTVNYHLGLARLALTVALPSGTPEARGTVLLQSYALADGTPCLKAALAWTGREGQIVRSVFSKPEVDWKREARKLAAEWMAGPPASLASPEAAPTVEPLAAAV